MNESKRGHQETILAGTVRKRLKIFDIPMDVFTSIYGNRVIYQTSELISFINWYAYHHNVFHQRRRSI